METRKKITISIDVILWIITAIPVINVLKECLYSAIHGTIPFRESFGNAPVEIVYGFPAFVDTLQLYGVFFFVFVVAWGGLLVFTLGFTAYTYIFCKDAKKLEAHF